MAADSAQILQLDHAACVSAVRKILETSHPALWPIAFAELQNGLFSPITF